jgi:hypothetical protein
MAGPPGRGRRRGEGTRMRSSRKMILRRTVLLSLTTALVVGQPMAALAAPNNAERANATVVEDDEFRTGVVTRRFNSPRPERFTFQGLEAGAFNWSVHEDGSFRTEEVNIVQGRALDPWSRGNNRIAEVQLWVEELEFDFDEGLATVTQWGGAAPLEIGGIGRLRDAYVDQDVSVERWDCTAPIWDDDDDEIWFECEFIEFDSVRVSVEWTGYGATTRMSERERFQVEGGTGTVRYHARARAADVVGGVTGDVLSFDMTGADGYLADVQHAESFRYARR